MKSKIVVMKRVLLALLLLPFIWGQTAWAFTIGEERKVGEKLLYSVRTAFPLIDDPDITRYVTDTGMKILKVSGQQYFDYHFFVIKSDEFNAFAAPSGLVFFYSGLIQAMNSEEEFVSVLAHEIGHVVKRHIADRVEKGKLIGAASLAAAVAALALGGGKASQVLLTGSLAAGQSASLHFSRKDEEEADLLAYGWMKDLHYDTRGQEAMLQTMRRVSRYRSEVLPQYLLTHPNPEARLDYVQSLIAAEEAEGTSRGVGEQFDFLRFKYRVMSQAMDSVALREQLAGVLSSAGISREDEAMARYGLSQVELQENNYRRALELLHEVRQIFPEKSILLTDMGVALFLSGQLAEAIVALEKSLAADGGDLYASFYLAKCYLALGQVERAEQIFTSIRYALPEYSKVYFELGQLATNRNAMAEASLYLGQYYLYEGKLKLAKFSLKNVQQDKTADMATAEKAEELLLRIEDLEKG